MSDLISRQAAIRWVKTECNPYGKPTLDFESGKKVIEHLEQMPSAQPEPKWIHVKTRPMTEEERKYYSELYGYDIEYEEAIMFDCKMPEDGQEIWVCSKCGNVWEDTCCVDEGIWLEGNGDWLDIVAWMPRIKPEPYREETEND